jgi:hypothetical protein
VISATGEAAAEIKTQQCAKEMITLKILVHEFTTLDGVIDAPTWTPGYPFDQDMGAAIGGIMESSKALLPLGR